MGNDDMARARAELSARIAAIEWRAGPARLAPDIDRIRHLAQRHRLSAAVTVAQLLGAALARGERGVLVHHWLALLGEAVACERQDEAASRTFAAACAVRFAA
ncbi:MAG: hypothetical protein DI544_02275 [Sphingomonas taxi]|uniref:Uncharacterized protein n=1 Tax=Sphingomonas taxi TaxID=1549858 RepID=A0A2W5PJS4_9SPHN|nr:MAG: hypothetical protein DI544_02275 [Sphingomonas taxi]